MNQQPKIRHQAHSTLSHRQSFAAEQGYLRLLRVVLERPIDSTNPEQQPENDLAAG